MLIENVNVSQSSQNASQNSPIVGQVEIIGAIRATVRASVARICAEIASFAD
jgi:hypothetical protein